LVLRLAIVNVRSRPEKPSFIFDIPVGWVEFVKKIDLTPIWDMIGPMPEGTPSTVDGPRDVVLLAEAYNPVAESRHDFENRLLGAARTAMGEIEEYLIRSPGLERVEKSEIERDVRRLYERTALRKVLMRIALDCGVLQSTVEDGITNAARPLNLKRPSNRGPSTRPLQPGVTSRD
jgi:hypothetical protein